MEILTLASKTSSESSPFAATFSFAPTIVHMWLQFKPDGSDGDDNSYNWRYGGTVALMSKITTTYARYQGAWASHSQSYCYTKKSSDGKTLYWYGIGDFCTESGEAKYSLVVIGFA